VNNLITYRCFQHRVGTDFGLHYVKCPKVPFLVTLVIYIFKSAESQLAQFEFLGYQRQFSRVAFDTQILFEGIDCAHPTQTANIAKINPKIMYRYNMRYKISFMDLHVRGIGR